jgi:ABC-type nickel/cobalt efflux system permease component RcnA
MSDDADKKKKSKKDKKKGGDAGSGVPVLRLADHPRAQRSIARVKSGVALVAFLFTIYHAHGGGAPLSTALQQGLIAGIGFYLVGWLGAVLVWRQLAQAELDAAHKQLLARVEELAAKREEERAAREAEKAARA